MNKERTIQMFITGIFFLSVFTVSCNRPTLKTNNQSAFLLQNAIVLPRPVYTSDISIEEALLKRRSVRRYKDEPIELMDISQLLWAAQGITSDDSTGRTAPSAGALYPLELYLVNGNINTLPPGVFHYRPNDHSLLQIEAGDKRSALSEAAHLQGSLNRSAAVIVVAAEFMRTSRKYSERGTRYVQMEAGHAAQNICLQAVSLNIGTVTIGSFSDSLVKQILNLPQTEVPLYLMPVGKIRD